MRKSVSTIVLALLVTAVVVTPGATAEPERSPDLPDVADADILRLSPKIANYLVKNIRYSQDPRSRVYDLVDLIRTRKGLDITYEKAGTKTAIETFESRRGNCLSFTILFVAMARHMGLNAYFQEVSEVMSWDRRGEIILRNQHMFAEVEFMNGHLQVDFLPGAEKRYRLVRRIGEQRALAHYYNNLAVDLLSKDESERSLAYFEKAITADPSFGPAWTNRGVAYRRRGDFAEAERSHLKAIEVDRQLSVAVANLASLFLATGREAEARPLLVQVHDHLAKSPFHRFNQGRRSLHSGRPREAIRHFKEAVRRMPKEGEFHVALAAAYEEAGEAQRARTSFREALRHLEDGEEKDRVRRKLEDAEPP